MAHGPKTVTIDESSELARLLAEAASLPLRLQAGGAVYWVTREELATPAEGADFNAAMDRLVGTWTSEDADAAIDYIYQAREDGSRPPTRP